MFDTHPTRTMPHHSANALASADFAKTQTHSAKTALFHRFSPNWSALWRPNPVKSRLRRHQSGGIALQEGATRRRHAARGLRVVQNPQRSPRQSRLHPSQCRRLHTPSATPTPSTPSMRSSSTPPPTPSVPSTPAPPAPKPKQLARTDADMAGVLADLGMLSLLGALAVAARRHGA